ncbi:MULTISPECIES: ABC transporter substrate-binding protein [Brenneria]|uniref:ABC transporter substrate-binding protein n=1 Tax=Brenneria nigrifluens DSM 30175 = ATCC 13028 TaxID=1121120 RepID=A0A2U1UJX5_9GAMM|nr:MULTISPECIES: ABC transporter substrate-binding protein [Brenneria]EHD20958.1 extracellular solute-binding protein family 1 [Brenneria sp. EniD312]PWC21985.1 iron ABC transporter substrate-binding protein [Brenneria nigrifluens DSM 30175 = ATCC 13028]QCR04118.1 ABC transporter substrate-binding protein [Brenneria nigrifluens DSM 30175 = ATCC 13028]
MNTFSFRRTGLIAALALSTLVSAAQAGTITVYTSLEEDEIKDYIAQAKKDMPDLKVNVLRLSTGDLGPRILAEAKNSQHDVLWGWALTNVMDKRISALLEPYAAKGADKLADTYRAPDAKWFAATGYMAAFCVNTEALKAKNLPVPASWQDLTNPVYKGEIVMPNPVSSGTGYLQIAALLQSKGDDRGWAFLKTLDGNIAQYTKSGSRPCKAARTGEFAIGVSLAFAAMQSIEEGYPVKMVIPNDGAGYELEASGLMAAAKNKPDARRFLDWTLSDNAAALYTKYKEIVTIPGVEQANAAKMAGLPGDLSSLLYPVDFSKSAEERDTILSQWQKTIGR